MTTELPAYYFRVRDNGAFVFRPNSDNRQRRMELDQIAVVNIRKGEIKPHGDRVLTDTDLEAIRDWMTDRAALLARREFDDIQRTVDALNAAAHWAQARATEAQLERITDDLLLAMHDLRSGPGAQKSGPDRQRISGLENDPDRRVDYQEQSLPYPGFVFVTQSKKCQNRHLLSDS